MTTVTIPKKEYKKLVEKVIRYEYLREIMEEDIFSPPPTRDIGEITRAFRATKKYDAKFLKSLDKGLRRSSYFKV